VGEMSTLQYDERTRARRLLNSLALIQAAMLPGMSMLPMSRPAALGRFVRLPRSLVNRCKCGRVISDNKRACLMCKAEEIASR
jgi:hypothetical protein